MRRFLFLSVILSASAMASPLGTCSPGALSTYIGNSWILGDKTFDNFTFSGNVAASNVGIIFRRAEPSSV